MEKFQILNKRENPAFNRQEIELNVEIEVTPKIKEAEEFIAKEFATNADNVKIRKIKGKFGSKNFIITANIYSSKEEKDKVETKNKKEKKKVEKK
ncbi:Ribosomal protein S24e [uncultured archaeon]|nr:Ribosomal protein S24e [uncultured archaeon]